MPWRLRSRCLAPALTALVALLRMHSEFSRRKEALRSRQIAERLGVEEVTLPLLPATPRERSSPPGQLPLALNNRRGCPPAAWLRADSAQTPARAAHAISATQCLVEEGIDPRASCRAGPHAGVSAVQCGVGQKVRGL